MGDVRWKSDQGDAMSMCTINSFQSFDRVLSLRQHESYTSRACRFHLRNISRIRKYIPQDISIVLIKSLVMSRLDYSNGLLYGLPKCTVSGLQAVQNSAARIVTQECFVNVSIRAQTALHSSTHNQ